MALADDLQAFTDYATIVKARKGLTLGQRIDWIKLQIERIPSKPSPMGWKYMPYEEIATIMRKYTAWAGVNIIPQEPVLVLSLIHI